MKDKNRQRLKNRLRDEKEREKFAKESAEMAINSLIVITAYVLRFQLKFGKKRMTKFFEYFFFLLNAVSQRKVGLKTLAEAFSDVVEYDFEKCELKKESLWDEHRLSKNAN